MELDDTTLSACSAWDPGYLEGIFSQDFYDFGHLWINKMSDRHLVHAVETIEKYNPLVEDISLDDDTLYQAAEEIEISKAHFQ